MFFDIGGGGNSRRLLQVAAGNVVEVPAIRFGGVGQEKTDLEGDPRIPLEIEVQAAAVLVPANAPGFRDVSLRAAAA